MSVKSGYASNETNSETWTEMLYIMIDSDEFERPAENSNPRGFLRKNLTVKHSVIFVNENENENGEKRENNELVNEN